MSAAWLHSTLVPCCPFKTPQALLPPPRKPHLVAKDALEARKGARQLGQCGIGLPRCHRLLATQPPVLLLSHLQLLRQESMGEGRTSEGGRDGAGQLG